MDTACPNICLLFASSPRQYVNPYMDEYALTSLFNTRLAREECIRASIKQELGKSV